MGGYKSRAEGEGTVGEDCRAGGEEIVAVERFF